jgi:hypothetical protein
MAKITLPTSASLNQELAVNGKTWKWDGTKWKSSVKPAGFAISETPPTLASQGDMWFSSSEAKNYIYYDSVWIEMLPVGEPGPTGPQGAPGKYYVSETAPSNPEAGIAWFNTADGRLYVYNGSAWFEPTNNQEGPTGPVGPSPSAGKIIAMAIVFGG